MFRTGKLDSLIEAATSNLNLEPPWPQIIKICDLIRQGDVHIIVELVVKSFVGNVQVKRARYQILVLKKKSESTPPRKTEQQLREEEELNLAIALSQSEAEAQKNKSFSRASSLPSRTANYSPPVTESPEKEDTDPELAHYLNRAYWENRQQNDTGTINRSPSAPTSAQTTAPTLPVSSTSSSSIQQLQNGGIDNNVDMDEFVSTLKSQVDVFVNRIKSNYSRGRSIANDSTVQTPFLNITAMHSKLLNFIQEQDDSRAYYEGLQDKFNSSERRKSRSGCSAGGT
ncbi:unnamed protein product [Bemisia tabaci]|uniref:VHS domain-containing protein n=1 Tax=Bemisia tabaci TaxID=7038 RepID=A0A9P0A6P2_BEMTA|nr:unnamed protein product [Bemisia tabaci]